MYLGLLFQEVILLTVCHILVLKLGPCITRKSLLLTSDFWLYLPIHTSHQRVLHSKVIIPRISTPAKPQRGPLSLVQIKERAAFLESDSCVES